MEQQSVLHRCIIVGATDNEPVLLSEFRFIGQCRLTFIEHIPDRSLHYLHQHLGNHLSADMYAHRMRLHHSRIAVAVNHQSGHIVPLSMHQSVGIIQGIPCNADAETHLIGCFETGIPERLVDLHIAERQDSDGNGAYLVMTNGKESVVCPYHPYRFSFGNTAVGMMNSTRKHPGMEALKTLLLAPFEVNSLVFHYL